MTKRRTILVSVVFFSIAVFTVQTLSRTRSSIPLLRPPGLERLWNMTEEEREKEFAKRREQWKLYLERSRNMASEERKRESAKRREQRELRFERLQNMTEEERKWKWKWEAVKERRQWELEHERSRKEHRKKSAERKRQSEPIYEMRRFEMDKLRKEWEKKKEEAGGFIFEKSALRAFGATEEQWKLIRAKLEKVQDLRLQLRSKVGLSLAGGSSDTNAPTWQWKRPWKDKVPSELTEAQRLAKELIALVEKKNTTPEAFRRKMAALRKARSEEAELRRQLADTHRELREMLTTRQEAALVLMRCFLD